jgi:hypothetical protein
MGTSPRRRPSAVAVGLLARPGAAPARSTPVEDLPRAGGSEAPPIPEAVRSAGGIKAATIGTTVYLLPGEHKRVRRLALDLDVPSVHELLLLGLDRLLAEQGQEAIERYSPPRPKKR